MTWWKLSRYIYIWNKWWISHIRIDYLPHTDIVLTILHRERENRKTENSSNEIENGIGKYWRMDGRPENDKENRNLLISLNYLLKTISYYAICFIPGTSFTTSGKSMWLGLRIRTFIRGVWCALRMPRSELKPFAYLLCKALQRAGYFVCLTHYPITFERKRTIECSEKLTIIHHYKGEHAHTHGLRRLSTYMLVSIQWIISKATIPQHNATNELTVLIRSCYSFSSIFQAFLRRMTLQIWNVFHPRRTFWN